MPVTASSPLTVGAPSVAAFDLRSSIAVNPTEYFTDAGLRALIRDPRSVRVWPEQRMPSFAEEDLSDEELGLILAYLSHMADRKSRATEGGSSKR